MKTSIKAALFAAILAVCAISASASPIDPGIIVRDPKGCPSGGCTVITGLTFNFSVPQAGFGLLHFLNSSGVTWTSLTLTELGVPAIDVTCTSDAFSCSVVAFGTGAKIVLTATGEFKGIPNGNSFEIILGCVNGDCPHWPGGLEFTAVANSVPEPASLVLLLGGVAGIYTRRKPQAKASA